MASAADLQTLFSATGALHRHLCPRQILGVRMGVFAGELLSIELPQKDKRLIAFVETDGCFADGVMVATGCSLGHRTMRLMDYGKVAVTVADTKNNRAVRISPSSQSRLLAARYRPDAPNRWLAQLEAYQQMPDHELLSAVEVEVTISLDDLVGKKGVRVNCEFCSEEILNGRERADRKQVLCASCAGESYWVARRQFRSFCHHPAGPLQERK